jgi:predicted phosphodiesterase
VLAVLYDVHGNLLALENVLIDARARGVQRFVLGGDYALFGPRPAETVAALEELDAQWIRGNGERWTATPSEAPDDPVVQGAVAACFEALGDATVTRLRALPESVAVGAETRFWHGSPVSDVRSFFPTPADDDAELLDGVSERRLVFGHTHLPFRRFSVAGVELVNPGSVGMPFDGDPRAAYALIGDDGMIEHRRVPYDHWKAADDLRERFGGGWPETVARRLERARFDV